MSAADFPRVLILSSSVFNHRTGGGVTLSNLFRGWPADRIACAHSDPEVPATDICTNYFKLGEAELGRAGLFRLIGRGPQNRGTMTPSLKSWVSAFAPDVVYTLLGSLGYIRLTEQVAAHSGAAIVPHMMDDWPSAIYGDSPVGLFLRIRLDASLRALLARSQQRLAISPAMASEYESRYGMKFFSISNPADGARWKREMTDHGDRSRTLLYVGSVLAEAQLLALTDIASAISALNSRGHQIRLTVATPNHADSEPRRVLGAFPFVTLTDAPGEDAIVDLIASASLLLLPANFNARAIRYLRLSNPTKVPAYMASGVPILVYAPSELDIVRRARRDGWGIVVDTDDPEQLAGAIVTGLNDETTRQRVTENARSVCARDHDGEQIRSEFRHLLQQAAVA